MRFSPAILIAAALAFAPLGCGHRNPPRSQSPTAPPTISTIDDLVVALNHFALLPPDHGQRAEYRSALLDYLMSYLDRAIEEEHPEEALAAVRRICSLYTPDELKHPTVVPPLAAVAHRFYRSRARRGDEMPSMLALALEQQFGGAPSQARTMKDWTALESWLVNNGPFASEPLLAPEDLERSLEMVAAIFPSPWIVDRLTELYLSRYQEARQSHARGEGLGSPSRRRIEITGYLLMRLYLRADDPQGARAAVDRVEPNESTQQLHAVLTDAFKSRRSAQTLLSLAEQFVPEPDADPFLPYVGQSWGIIDNLSLRALKDFPKDPYVHLLRARSLRWSGLDAAALHHLRRSIELKDDIFEVWQERADLEQRELSRLAQRDADAALERLAEVEAFHQRAMKLWSDRPIRPALPQAYFTVADALYHAGSVAAAKDLLDKSRALEAEPNTVDLLGTIAFKRGQLDQAQAIYNELIRLPEDPKHFKLRWDIRGRSRLGQINLRQGNPNAAAEHFRKALRQTNELLVQPAVSAAEQADRYLTRGQLLFYVGDVPLALQDYETAAQLAPEFAKVYSEPLLQLVSYGYYNEAHSIFLRALGRDEIADDLKLYFSLWLNDLALRQRRPPDPKALEFMSRFTGNAWGQKLARHARGDLSYEALLGAARDNGERAEAFFYEGLRRWRAGDQAQSKKLLTQVLQTELMGFFEYDMAQSYLEWNEMPTTARSPVTRSVAQRNLSSSP